MIVNSCLALLLMIAFGQGNAQLPPDFPTLQKVAIEELKLKTDAHRAVWGLDHIQRWDLSQDAGELVFSLTGGMKATAPAQIIGTYNTDGLNGDMKRGGQIVIADGDPASIRDNARPLVPRANGVTNFYPSISNDSKLVVFNQSTCGSVPDVNRATADSQYGNQSCDGYDDSTSTLWIVKPSPGATATRLDNANGPAGSGNSWPRFSPDKGNFRGDLIYSVAFSSRRAYGSQVNYNASPSATKPQLWISAVRTGENIVGDPSWAPVWMPTQNPKQMSPQGNHVPQWVKVVVVIEG